MANRVVWLPYGAEEAEQKLGGLPDGLTVEAWTSATELPGSVADVEFAVMPYMAGPKALERIEEMTSLQVLQLQSAGYENVVDRVPDGVTLCNGGGIHDTATAELAVALALASGRHLDRFARQQATATWDATWGVSLADQDVAIVGYGRIGKAIEARLGGFEVASVTRFARSAKSDPEVRPVEELAEHLPRMGTVFVITPLTEQTEGLFDAEMLARMADGALLVNVSRGPVVDTDALLAETSSGRLRAALDVTDPEPLPSDHPLWGVENVLISPHVGGYASSFERRRDRLVAAQVRRFAAGEPLENVVN
ncbi:dihydrofolate reductase [Auraticoccus sp. F435]|uniref:Dihydrofolate reductase n=1 Tax=Auraticoccus cholistanensis TaxID=2656650 RepID=A0A6A9V0L8_9ACTN|nr:2-hydroxyacid dehydrogenase [Auraticoccus cholistanensis]MVA75620.1 dihydrofolate reductase [Auraticoccus cholistanensis]